MQNQSVILRKAKETEVKQSTQVLIPEGVFLTAYKQLWLKVDKESRDDLQAVAEKIIGKIKNKDCKKWEFKSSGNMTIFMRGSIKKKQIDNAQSHGIALKDSLQNVVEEVPDWKRIPRIDLYDDIRNAKKPLSAYVKAKMKKDKDYKPELKPLFDDNEKTLITMYLEKGLTVRQVAKAIKQKRMAVQRQLESIYKKVARLPIRGLHGFIESDGINRPVHVEQPDSRPLVTRIGLLRRYRRTKDVQWIDKYNENSEKILTEHECRVACDTDKTALFIDTQEVAVSSIFGQSIARTNQDIIDSYHMTVKGLTLCPYGVPDNPCTHRALRLQSKGQRIARAKARQYAKGVNDLRHLAYWHRLCGVQVNPFNLT